MGMSGLLRNKDVRVAAGLGCAVANATDEAKAAANYVCAADNNAGAVAEVIEKFVLGQ